jgi:hypothetical protein
VSESSQPSHSMLAVLVNAAITTGVVVGAFSSSQYGQNLALGLSWLAIALTPLAVIAMCSSDEKMAELRLNLAKRPRYRIYFCRACDVVIVLTLAIVGWWWTFGFYIFHSIVSLAIEGKGDDELKKQRKSNPDHEGETT